MHRFFVHLALALPPNPSVVDIVTKMYVQCLDYGMKGRPEGTFLA